MNDGFELHKSLTDESVQRVSEKNKTSEVYSKNLHKHGECTKCHTIITRDIFKKDRTICRKCYCKFVLENLSNKLDSANKQESSSNLES